MSAEAASSTIRSDIAVMTGGNFTGHALGDLPRQITERARQQPREYLREFESMFVSGGHDSAISKLHPQVLLSALADLEPERVRRLATRLAERLGQALRSSDSVMEEFGDLESLPPSDAAQARRLRILRSELHRLAGARA